ncbi:MAG: tripartite tricarboxylate transporter substrate binding protein [Comamonadaceae bacterium]|nr:MAG: tripartite tricarboxylate transporter substrate binding protein [Comamonadaceae bacterium]
MQPTRRRALTALALPLLAAALPAQAQDFPNRPVRLLVPYAAGGGTDVMARQIAKAASVHLGQQIVVDNKPGAGTGIAAAEVARATGDGYTILWGDSATFAVNPHVYAKLQYDPLTSFAPVTLAVRGLVALSVSPSRIPAKNVEQLIAYVRANPNKLSYGTPGNATPHHLAMESFKLAAGGLSIQHIPYKGEAPAMQDLVSGNLDMMFSGVRLARAQAESGRAVMLAVSGPRRNAVIPDVPTLAEAGLKGFSYQYWHGIVAPASTPPAVVARLNAAFTKALREEATATWLREVSGTEAAPSTPAEMRSYMESELKSAGTLVKAINLKLD